jgi:3-hydroxyacyl-[acyl-carrier-protein] dehydratase
MSGLAQEVRQCMSSLTEAGGDELTARFLFPARFIGFQGHFPNRPILPAVCKIQAAIAMLEAWKRDRVRLNEISLAKFSAPVGCDEEVQLRCRVEMEDGHRATVRATVAKGSAKVARFKLRVSFEHWEGGGA